MNDSLLTRTLLSWFVENQRPLPWRKEYHPYHVWISEIMGQQTQMERVVAYFNNWIRQFPDIKTLAAASEQEVIKAWEGLGYYSRVRNIRKAADILVQEYGAKLPDKESQLLALPGIGPYTAAAILSIAFNHAVPLLDANVERILCRIDDIDLPVKQATTRKLLLQRCSDLLPQDDARNFNQALMEFGALICTPKKPACPTCPLQQHCRSYARDIVDLRPIPGKKEKRIDISMACGIIQHGDRFYIQQRLKKDVWGGLWEFPGGRLKEGETPEQAAVREILEETEFQVTDLRPFATTVHHYTKYRVTLEAFFCTLQGDQLTEPVLHAASQYKWVAFNDLSTFAFPAGHRQLIEKMD
ncbi:A/G-specific DNA-adenine glycosylase [Candidatus Electrothrix marina]|uniref:Adenine DNA glycosylase n=1 Tax=Candidatus Electrothrix marina TaxID=1859130 RepID=A0A444JEH0_9BACT|nr:A/G-specific DNA-adenine glycosylase [Candidatus Electrothrix marina]